MNRKIEQAGTVILIVFICLGLCSVVLPAMSALHSLKNLFFVIGYISGGVFTIEYIWRIVRARRSVGSRGAVRRYIFSFAGIVDLISILPFTLPYILPINAQEITFIDAARVFLIFKLARYSQAFRLLGQVIISVKKHLATAMLIPLTFASFSAILIYYLEPTQFTNLGDGFYWAMITMATVGYGDFVPLTDIGKLLASLTAMAGILFIALPTGIISSAFTTRMKSQAVEQRMQRSRGSSQPGLSFTAATTSAARARRKMP